MLCLYALFQGDSASFLLVLALGNTRRRGGAKSPKILITLVIIVLARIVNVISQPDCCLLATLIQFAGSTSVWPRYSELRQIQPEGIWLAGY